MSKCGTCRYYPHPEREEDDCFFYPPKIFQQETGDGRTIYENRRAEVLSDDMACGQYKKRG